MTLRDYGSIALRGAMCWGVPMFAVLGALLYFKTRPLISEGGPPETMNTFWWPFVPTLLLWFLVLGVLLGVATNVITRRISSRHRHGV